MEAVQFGHESQTVEFKTSFCHSANHNNPDQAFNIFRAVDSILNSDGGKIYIGIDDSGKEAVGINYGVKGDMNLLHIKSNDAYCRYINQKMDGYFKDAKHIHSLAWAVETDNENVIVINVNRSSKIEYIKESREAAEYVAFERKGAQTYRMDRQMISAREAQLAKIKKAENAENRIERMKIMLQRAIDNKKKVILYKYASNHGGTYRDRVVEPFEFICNGNSIWAYEAANEGSEPLRQFKLSRISSVKVLDEGWENEDKHMKAFVDAFEWARPYEPSMHLTIMLSVRARNRLIETTPFSEKDIVEIGDGQWMLDTMVHSVIPVKEFCEQNRKEIEVYAPDELKEELGIAIAVDEKIENESKTTSTATIEDVKIERQRIRRPFLLSRIFSFVRFANA